MATIPALPPLRTDLLTKFKQMLVALPSSWQLINTHYDELFATSSLEAFFSLLASLYSEYAAAHRNDPAAESLMVALKYYVERLLTLYAMTHPNTDEPGAIHIPFRFFAKEDAPPTPNQLLLSKLGEAPPETLRKAVEIISPTDHTWDCSFVIDDLSPNTLEELFKLLNITVPPSPH